MGVQVEICANEPVTYSFRTTFHDCINGFQARERTRDIAFRRGFHGIAVLPNLFTLVLGRRTGGVLPANHVQLSGS